MYFPTLLLNFMVTDFAVILDLFTHKNIHHGVTLNLNSDALISTYKIFHDSNLSFSSKVEKSRIPHSYEKVGLILNASRADWRNAFDSFDLTKAFKSPFVWMVITGNLEETIHFLRKLPIEVDSDFTIILQQGYNFSLYEIYNTGFSINGVVIVRNIGFWSNDLHIVKKDRLDLRGLVLKTTVVITKNTKIVHKTFEDFLDHEQPSLITVDPMHKFKYFEVLKYYRDLFNISYIFQRSDSWGYPTNGSFDGMMGALQRFEADIGGSPLFVRTDRSKAIDYAAETWQTRPCFIFRHPKHPSGFYTIYTRPLSTTVWYCILAFMLLSTSILGLMLRLKTIKANPGDGEDTSTSLAFLFIWSAICQQGMTIAHSATSIKIVMFVTFLCALTLYQYYNATVVSTLLHEPPKTIRTMEDLLKSNMKAGIEDVLYNKDFFKRTTDPLAIEMYHKRIATATEYNFYPSELGMSLVKRGGYAFHIDSAVAYRIMKNTFDERELCDATEVSMFVPQYLGAAVTKGSPYKEHIAYALRKMKECGIMKRLQNQWDSSRPGCVRTSDSRLIAVSVREFSTALIALAMGHATAAILLAGEVLVSRLEKRKCRIAFRK